MCGVTKKNMTTVTIIFSILMKLQGKKSSPYSVRNVIQSLDRAFVCKITPKNSCRRSGRRFFFFYGWVFFCCSICNLVRKMTQKIHRPAVAGLRLFGFVYFICPSNCRRKTSAEPKARPRRNPPERVESARLKVLRAQRNYFKWNNFK